MYEEGSRKLSFNWVSLALKLVGLAIFVFLLCWVFTRATNNSTKTVEKDTDYINNITAMKEAAFEYFTESKLPEKVGGTEKLSLSQMLNQKLLIDFTDDGDTCDIESSYVQTTKTADGDYALKVSLDCDDKKDFIVTTIEKTKCVIENNCDTKTEDKTTANTDTNTNNNTSTNTNNSGTSSNNNSSNSNSSNSNTSSNTNKTNTSSSSSTTTQKVTTTVTTKVHITISCTTCNGTTEPEKPSEDEKVLWYKHEKYTNWEDGYSSASNAENKKTSSTTYNYCKENSDTIYTTSYLTQEKQNYEYTLRLLDYKASKVNSVSLIANSSSYFSNSLTDYRTYINTRDEHIAMVGATGNGNSYITNATTFKNSSLKKSNFTFTVSSVYQSGNYYYVDIDIKVKNASGVTKYYDSTLGYSLYYVPLKFDIVYSYNSDCTRDTEANSYKYQNHTISDPETTITWKHRFYETTWSTEKSLSGWTYTGTSEYRTK